MAYQMLIGSAFQTTLEIFHQIFQIFLRDLHIGSTEQQGVRTRQSGKRTVKFSKIDKQPEQSKKTGQAEKLVLSEQTEQLRPCEQSEQLFMIWTKIFKTPEIRCYCSDFQVIILHSDIGKSDIIVFCYFIQIKPVPNGLVDKMNIFDSLDQFI